MTKSLLAPSFLAQLDRLVLVTRQSRVGALKGERRSPRHGGSVEFADFRAYAPGDDFRQIDWNAYARLERLFLRLFVEEEDTTVHILLDASESMNWGEPRKFDYARRVAAALGYIALVGMDRLMAAALGSSNGATNRPTDDQSMRPLRGKAQSLAWFNWLSRLHANGVASPTLTLALAHYAATMRRPGRLILLSDLLDDGWRDGIKQLARSRYELTLLHILALEELDPALEGDLKLVDSETSAAVEITADFDLLARYRVHVRDWQAEWQQFCAARAIHYVPIATSLPFEQLVLSVLRRRGVLK